MRRGGEWFPDVPGGIVYQSVPSLVGRGRLYGTHALARESLPRLAEPWSATTVWRAYSAHRQSRWDRRPTRSRIGPSTH